MTSRRTLAIGDPQAPFATFLAVLERHGVLDARGRLKDDTALISLGDHFDWGAPDERERAAADSMELVRWLASHPPDQVVMIAGNHDLARVGELFDVDDATFAAAQALADASYRERDPAARARFDAAHPRFLSDEMVARDLSTFRVEQRALVDALLESGRLRLAHVDAGVLFVHAGVTNLELDALGLKQRTAPAIAAALNAALDAAVAVRKQSGGPLVVPGIHVPGDHLREGVGALYHRPSRGLDDDERRELDQPWPRRRFDPATLPRGVVQAIGHIRDAKCRKLLADVCDARPAGDGPLRSLVVTRAGMRYARGVPQQLEPSTAVLLFLDGGMNALRDHPERYELLDVKARAPALPR